MSRKIIGVTVGTPISPASMERKMNLPRPIITSAEGKYLTLTDSADYPVQDLKLYVKASQSGTGDPTPTNIRPITHRESVWLTVMDDNAIQHYDNTIALPENSGCGYVDYMRNKYVQTHALAEIPIASMNNSDDYPGWNGQSWLKNAKQNKWYVLEAETNIGFIPYGRADWQLCYFAQSEIGYSQTELKEQFPNLVVQILYELQTPVEHDLEELPEIATLYPTTIIPYGGNMSISYVADTKNYIDKKFTELATAIVANA